MLIDVKISLLPFLSIFYHNFGQKLIILYVMLDLYQIWDFVIGAYFFQKWHWNSLSRIIGIQQHFFQFYHNNWIFLLVEIALIFIRINLILQKEAKTEIKLINMIILSAIRETFLIIKFIVSTQTKLNLAFFQVADAIWPFSCEKG